MGTFYQICTEIFIVFSVTVESYDYVETTEDIGLHSYYVFSLSREQFVKF
jgi:hypothetical protein